MNPDLVALKQRVIDTEKMLLRWSAENTSGKTATERVAIDIAYRKARRAYHYAKVAYADALEEAVKSQDDSGKERNQ